MPNVSHKFISVYSRATSDLYANTDVNLFIDSIYSPSDFVSKTDSESGNSLDSTTGELTISSGGQYHAFLSLNCDGAGVSAVCSIKILIDNTEVYGSSFATNFNTYSGGGERTFHTILSISDGQKVKVVVNTNNASVDISIKAGTVFSLVSSESSYGINTRTGNTDKDATEHNPFQSGTYSQAYTSAFTSMSGGIGYTDIGWQSSYGDSPTFIVASYQPTVTTNQDIDYRLYKNTAPLVYYTATTINGENGYERTIPAIFELTTSPSYDYVKPTMDAGVDGGAYINSGSSFSVDRIRETAYMSMLFDSNSSVISANGNYLSFLDSGSYPTFIKTDLVTATDLSYDQNSGNITIGTSGFYLFSYTTVLSASTSDSIISNKITKNSATPSAASEDVLYETGYTIDLDSGNTERTIFTILELEQNDTIQLWTTKTSGGGIKQSYGILSLFMVGDPAGGGDGGGGYGQSYPGLSVVNPLMGLDSTNIDLLGSNSLAYAYKAHSWNYILKSSQHDRYVEQIPFSMQVPGPLSLRNTGVKTTSVGKKENN